MDRAYLDPGEEWQKSIVEAIEACQIIVVVFSLDADKSPQVLREVTQGINKGKKLILFRIEDAKPSGSMEFAFTSVHWLDAFTLPMERHLFELGEAVAGSLRRLFPDGHQDGLSQTARRVIQPLAGPKPWAAEPLPPL